ncbi:MAG: sensor histidine kinase [Bacillota bacterium]|nr:sensor histidine kinase [Bacillota bacterium]
MLRKYLKKRRFALLGFLLFYIIFYTSFYLYHLPLSAVVYPGVICLVFGMAFFAVDYSRTLKRHKRLEEMKKLSAALMTDFPEADDSEDEDYQEIIRLLCQEQRHAEQEYDRRYSDMTDYYTVWAHQIKTPIASMRLKLQNEDSATARKLSADLNRIEQYVEMVLAFLRLDSYTTDYVFRDYELDAIIRQSVKKFSGEFIGRRLSLSYEPVSATVKTDEKWLCFVLEQILSNALKYTQSGGITVGMEGERSLFVRDTGIGIAPEDLPRIFEKGFTGFNGREDKKASGLGLYLCKRVCENLGIGIRAESKPDVGTVIYLDFAEKTEPHE